MTYPEAAKTLHVSVRTLHNWASGTHAVPYAVTKCLRMMRYTELPGQSWSGWHFSRGCLVSPEGRTIEGHESAWWSMMVGRAKAFNKVYQELKELRRNAAALEGPRQRGGTSGPQPTLVAATGTGYSEACLSKTALQLQEPPKTHPHGNHGDHLDKVVSKRYQTDTIQTLWPSASDSPHRLIPSPVRTASGSESPSIPLSVSPLMPIYNVRMRLQSSPNLSPSQSRALPLQPLPFEKSQSTPLAPCSLSSSLDKSQSLTLSPSLVPIQASQTAPSWRTGTEGTRQSNASGGGL
jgi:hypothetical protein